MNTYAITVVCKLYSINRLVEANTADEAMATVAEHVKSCRWAMCEDVTGQPSE